MRLPRRTRAWILFAAGVAAAAVLATASLPWRLDRAAVGRAVGQQVAGLLGLDVAVRGPVTLKLLPRPRLRIGQVSASGSAGAILVDVPEVKAELDIGSLIRGRWRLASATLVAPTVTIDLDRAEDAAIVGSAPSGGPDAVPLRIRTRSGVLRTLSSNAAADLILTDIDASVAWPVARGALSGSGTLAWRGAPARFATRIEHLSDLATPDGSTASLEISSPTLTLAADGLLTNRPRGRFTGHVATLVPSLPKLLQFPVDSGRAAAGRIQLVGDVIATANGLSFSDASFRMNGGRFEGTLAVRRDEAKTTVEGTLATDLLDVDGLLADETGEGSLASLYRRPLAAASLDADVDLRISASKVRAGRVTLDDAALAVLLRDGRLDLSLDEAGLCGGRVKGRAVTRLGPDGATASAEGTAAKVDIAALSAMLGGAGQVGGVLSGDAALEGTGRNLREIVATLGGRGQVTVEKGRLAGLSLARVLNRFGARLPIAGLRADRATVFDKAVWPFSVDRGRLTIRDGRLTAPGVAMSFSGETDLPDGRVDVVGTAVETDTTGALLTDSPRLPFTMRGSWDGSLVLVGHVAERGLPSLVLPLIGTSPPLP